VISEPTEPVVVVDRLRKSFLRKGIQASRSVGEIVAVDDVSFEVPLAGSLAIVGESGSGKTTAARMIVGLERPTAGTITVAGRLRGSGRLTPSERKRRGREIQIVFQDPYLSLDPRQTVFKCLNEVLRLHFDWDGERRRHRISELLSQVGLHERFATQLPRAMSGGERQRVAIARALAAEPQVLVLDEAVSALDVSIQAQIINLLSDLRGQTSVAFVFISHNLAVVRQVSDDLIVMRNGKIVESGPTPTVLEAPKSEYTKALLAAVPGPGWRPPHRIASATSSANGDRPAPDGN